MFTQFGDKTRTVFLKGIESHKLHQEFEVGTGETIVRGTPVVLKADGTIAASTGAAEDHVNVIGYSIHNGKAGELVTVGMRAFTIIYGVNLESGTITAGPVKFAGVETVTDIGDYNAFENIDPADTTTAIGWALDGATADHEIVRIALF